MRKALLAGVMLAALVAVMASPAWADGTIPWEGNGSDNLPCTDGGHWVLAPAHDIDSATLYVDGESYPMTQSGQGSWSADSVGAIDEGVDAYVTYTGEGDEKNHLQLSHCTDDDSTPSPTPTDTETPSPSVGGGGADKCEGHGQDRPKCQTATRTAPAPIAFTGIGDVIPWALAGLGFAVIGTLALRAGRRRA